MSSRACRCFTVTMVQRRRHVRSSDQPGKSSSGAHGLHHGLRGGADRRRLRGRCTAISGSTSSSPSRSSATASISPSPRAALGLATIVPTRPGDRRRGFVAALLAVVIGVGRRLHAAQLVPARPAVARASTTSRPTPPIRRRWSSPCRCAAARPIRRPIPAPAPACCSAPPIPTSCRSSCRCRRPRPSSASTPWRWRWAGTSSRARRPRAASRRSPPATGSAFSDDIVVRIRADGTGSRVDIRSKSRVGESDLGVNARRIREFIATVEGGEVVCGPLRGGARSSVHRAAT